MPALTHDNLTCARQICRIVPYFSWEMAASTRTKFTKGKRYRGHFTRGSFNASHLDFPISPLCTHIHTSAFLLPFFPSSFFSSSFLFLPAIFSSVVSHGGCFAQSWLFHAAESRKIPEGIGEVG